MVKVRLFSRRMMSGLLIAVLAAACCSAKAQYTIAANGGDIGTATIEWSISNGTTEAGVQNYFGPWGKDHDTNEEYFDVNFDPFTDSSDPLKAWVQSYAGATAYEGGTSSCTVTSGAYATYVVHGPARSSTYHVTVKLITAGACWAQAGGSVGGDSGSSATNTPLTTAGTSHSGSGESHNFSNIYGGFIYEDVVIDTTGKGILVVPVTTAVAGAQASGGGTGAVAWAWSQGYYAVRPVEVSGPDGTSSFAAPSGWGYFPNPWP